MQPEDYGIPRQAIQNAYQALANGIVRYPSDLSPLEALANLVRMMRRCANAVESFRSEHPAAVNPARFAVGAVGVFNQLSLDRGAARAGLSLTDILLAARGVADLPACTSDEFDPRPLGRQVAVLFRPGDDVCIDGEILHLADELEFNALVKLSKNIDSTAHVLEFASASAARDEHAQKLKEESASATSAGRDGRRKGGRKPYMDEIVKRFDSCRQKYHDVTDLMIVKKIQGQLKNVGNKQIRNFAERPYEKQLNSIRVEKSRQRKKENENGN